MSVRACYASIIIIVVMEKLLREFRLYGIMFL
jgi:hypothetical protein